MAINYNEIIENLKDEDVFHLLERLGAEPIDKGDFILCKTICHNPDPKEASYKLYYYKNSHIFYCYTEDGAQSRALVLEVRPDGECVARAVASPRRARACARVISSELPSWLS